MYLKSIEMHGFKSFANKIVLDFHDGITGIVGPNGSGKSNVADAVRWVLGEQSAKQLRGSNMQDVIFSGTEARKPLGYAYVAITMDNSDHKLPIEYEELTVSRRVYRSGESEYMINGAICRLRDVQELFLDTGIGKEGYSIIGQGQIDKILSGKPDERRELFDEAAGIVKFKKRKTAAEKNLEAEKMNLARINDILAEIEKQIGPLEKQSLVAKEYLKYKEELKLAEVNLFLNDYEVNFAEKEKLNAKYNIVKNDLDTTTFDLESAKIEYEKLDSTLEELNVEIGDKRTRQGDLKVGIEKAEGEIKLLSEQMTSLSQTEKHYNERLIAIDRDKAEKQKQADEYAKKEAEVNDKLETLYERNNEIEDSLSELRDKINKRINSIESFNNDTFAYLNEDAEIKGDIRRSEALLEQVNISKADFNKRRLAIKAQEDKSLQEIEECSKRLKETADKIAETTVESEQAVENLRISEGEYENSRRELAKRQQEQSVLDSKLGYMRNLAERYEGYGNSVKKVMERRNNHKGIVGVVADIFTVERKYETAIETALGASIQNIVTDTETTAKEMVEYLKTNKFGRATFLPLDGIAAAKNSNNEDKLKEKGVIGTAYSLVKTESRFDELMKYLLGRIIVVDNIDNALVLARRNNYSLRIVTLEGEQLNPGGSISGGAYKNNSNLLGRKRELEELETQLAQKAVEVKEAEKLCNNRKNDIEKFKNSLEETKKALQELFVQQNTEKLGLNQAEKQLAEVREEYSQTEEQAGELETRLAELLGSISEKKAELKQNHDRSEENKDKIKRNQSLLEEERSYEKQLEADAAELKLSITTLEQNVIFNDENSKRVKEELAQLTEERERLLDSVSGFDDTRKDKEEQIKANTLLKENSLKELENCEKAILDLGKQRDEVSEKHKNFLNKREELMTRVNSLDRELERLANQRERQEEQINSSITHIWEEYGLTPSTAESFRNEEYSNSQKNKRGIAELKGKIKALGDVNVNAIEDYKNVSERYEFLTTQRNDLQKSEEALIKIIEELDGLMREQFKEKFVLINQQFDVVFKELFGGGKGTLELMEDEDVLEAGIKIIAQPPGKKLQNMMQLSGGEKALTAIALLFAIQNLKPSPFCLLDEIEAALDDSNVGRFANYLNKLTRETQFIIITHRRGTMAAADRLYGITMQEKGVSALVSVNLIESALDK